MCLCVVIVSEDESNNKQMILFNDLNIIKKIMKPVDLGAHSLDAKLDKIYHLKNNGTLKKIQCLNI